MQAGSGPLGQGRPAAGPRLPGPGPSAWVGAPSRHRVGTLFPKDPSPGPTPRQHTSPSATFFAGCVDTNGRNLEQRTARQPQLRARLHPGGHSPERPASDCTWPGAEARDAGPVPRGLKRWPLTPGASHSRLLHPGLATLHSPRPRGLSRSLDRRAALLACSRPRRAQRGAAETLRPQPPSSCLHCAGHTHNGPQKSFQRRTPFSGGLWLGRGQPAPSAAGAQGSHGGPGSRGPGQRPGGEGGRRRYGCAQAPWQGLPHRQGASAEQEEGQRGRSTSRAPLSTHPTAIRMPPRGWPGL